MTECIRGGVMMDASDESGNNTNEIDPETGERGIPQGRLSAYTMPGVLQFLQTELEKFEVERTNWEVERAELEARINFLRGERTGQENLKQDLVRRIKMLEYALKEERVKYHQLKAAASGQASSTGPRLDNSDVTTVDGGIGHVADNRGGAGTKTMALLQPGDLVNLTTEKAIESSAKWRESRMRLRQFLQEVNCTDNVVTSRQSRVLKQLLAASNKDAATVSNQIKDAQLRHTTTAGDDSLHLTVDSSIGLQRKPMVNEQVGRPALDIPGNRFRRVGPSDPPRKLTPPSPPQEDDDIEKFKQMIGGQTNDTTGDGAQAIKREMMTLANALSDANFRGHPGDVGGESPQQPAGLVDQPTAAADDSSLGNLANVSVANEVDSRSPQSDSGPVNDSSPFASAAVTNNDYNQGQMPGWSPSATVQTSSQPQQPVVGSNWVQRYSLRGHCDSVRTLLFHPTDSLVFSGGEDGVVIVWSFDKNLSKWLPTSSSSTVPPIDELEPVQILHGHSGPVLCLGQIAALSTTTTSSSDHQDSSSFSPILLFSAGIDGYVRSWQVPSSDPSSPVCYHLPDLYAPSPDQSRLVRATYRGSSSPIWSLVTGTTADQAGHQRLVGLHADAIVDVWVVSKDTPVAAASAMPIRPLRSINLVSLDYPLLTGADDSTTNVSKLNPRLLGRPTGMVALADSSSPELSNLVVITTSTGWLLLLQHGAATNDEVKIVGAHCVNKEVAAEAALPSVSGGDLTASLLDSSSFNGAGWTSDGIYTLTLSANPSTVYTGHADSSLRRFSLEPVAGGGIRISPFYETSHWMAHVDSTSCLVIDPQTGNIITASHDASVRVWDALDRRCIQELSHHRLKNDEAINCIGCHPNLPFLATAGADSTLRIYASLPTGVSLDNSDNCDAAFAALKQPSMLFSRPATSTQPSDWVWQSADAPAGGGNVA